MNYKHLIEIVPPMGEKVVITGGAGFIGSKLAQKLSREGYEVVVIDDLSGGYEDNLLAGGEHFAKFVKADIRSQDIAPHFKGASFVFHLAAISALPVCQSEPGRAMEVNVAGTANVLEMSRRFGAGRVIFASTSAIYENNASFPCKETDPVNPHLMYSVSKFAAESVCHGFAKTYGMDVVITRYYNVYGPHQDVRRKSPPFVGYIIRELLNNRAPILHSNGEQKRDYVFIDDVNRINSLCMTHRDAPGKTFNVASGKAYSVNEMYSMVAKLLKSSIKPVFREPAKFWDKYPELYGGRYGIREENLESEVNKFTLGSTENAKRVLGWEAKTPIESGLAETVEHAKKILSEGNP